MQTILVHCSFKIGPMTSGGNIFNDFPETVPTREITTTIGQDFSRFLVGGRGPVSWMGATLQHLYHRRESDVATGSLEPCVTRMQARHAESGLL